MNGYSDIYIFSFVWEKKSFAFMTYFIASRTKTLPYADDDTIPSCLLLIYMSTHGMILLHTYIYIFNALYFDGFSTNFIYILYIA